MDLLGARVLAMAAAAAAVAVGSGCKKKPAPIDGIGQWHINRTQLSEGFVCAPRDSGITYCSNQPDMSIAGHRASVDLYFGGTQPSAPLAEILLAMTTCDVQAVDAWLAKKLGPAPGQREKALVWPGPASTVVALLPAPDGECRIHFLAPDDERRLAQLADESLDHD